MLLSVGMEYGGQCKEVLDFYASVFPDASVMVRNYKEMPNAGVFGMTGIGLELVWKSFVSISYGKYDLCIDMADSFLAAMNHQLDYAIPFYKPVICVLGEEEQAKQLFRKLYGDERSFEELRLGEYPDKYGSRWSYEYGTEAGICYCLEFDGFCADVIAYYEKAFDITATEVVRYGESLYADKVRGKDKIYNALLEFTDGGRKYAMKLRDSMKSAVDNLYEYDPTQLLFYQMLYNPILNFSDKDNAYLQNSFQKLSVGAKLNKPFAISDNADVCGSLIDKYGICWNFYNL